MCGIAGTVGNADRATICAMTDLLAHRGPDDEGCVVLRDQGVALGHRRLSIIDLSDAGHQPMRNGSGELWVTYNGEIYNYRELREELRRLGYAFRSSSDTEVLLASYEAWGEACLDRLNGMFAFAIYDRRRRTLFAARDRLGVKPFYYFHGPRVFVFASEIKALFACPGVPRRPDLAALATPARYQVAPYTGFEGIRKLPPGCSLTYAEGKLSVRRYWNLAVSEDVSTPDGAALEQLDARLRRAVERQMVADVPVGMFLSGGLDSSLVGALMRRHTNRDIHAFTIRFSDRDQRFERMPDDSYYARRLAASLGFRYQELEIEPDVHELLQKMVWHLDEPLSDPAAINTYLIARAAREKGIVVLLNGMAGDEVFAGYRKHLACLRAEQYQAVVPTVLRRIFERFQARVPVASSSRGWRVLRWGKRFLSFASLDELDRFLASDLSLSEERYRALYLAHRPYRESVYYRAHQASFAAEHASFLARMCVNDTRFFLAEHNLLYSDKAAMAAGVESRPPFTDHELVEYAFSLPPRQRIRGNTQKFLLKRVAEKYLPRDVIHRPKAPFGSPLRSWVRGPLAGLLDEVLVPGAMRSAELYDPRYVRELIERDREGLDDNALTIWTILTNEMWFRTFFAAHLRQNDARPLGRVRFTYG
jgi:asparagine synthase (glutamine-hydrolysing)